MWLTRPVSFYIVRMYVPLCIVVMISWTSFWVDYRSLSARVTVGITTVLTIVELRLKIYKGDAPAGQTVNFFDYYSLICFFFVFTALIEYSFAQSMDIKYRLQDWYLATQVSSAVICGELLINQSLMTFFVINISPKIEQGNFLLLFILLVYFTWLFV